MAYPAPNEVRRELPNNGRGVTDAQLELYTADGIEIVTLGNLSAEENALSRRAVRAYVVSEALREMRRNGDHIPDALITGADDRAIRYADEYRSSTPSDTDDAGYRPKAIITETPW